MPQHFFAKQLKGETPLSLDTAEQLCLLAARILPHQPWRRLLETNLVFVRRDGGDLYACSVMGALGEVFVIIAYYGLEGYHFFQEFQTTENMSAESFYGAQRSVYLEYEKRSALTPPDRQLLRAVSYPESRGARLPMFRAVRPGYHPWYITEPEGAALADVLAAMLFACEQIADDRPYWWDIRGAYPLLRAGAPGEPQFAVEPFRPPPPEPLVLAPPAIDAKRLQKILANPGPAAGVLQLDHFLVAVKIGAADERKSLAHLALAVDAKSGFVYPPELRGPGAPAADLLADAILRSLEAGAPRPREIHICKAEYRPALAPLAAAIGARVLVRKSLPALELAREGLLGVMSGGPL